jgi:predicted outer membrane repeat protein
MMFMVIYSLSSTAKTLYVDHNAQGKNPTGESWRSAFSDLQEAIDAASTNGGGEVWVKAGIYTPAGVSRNGTFKLKPNVTIYGGFRGRETTLQQRNFKANRTTLSGDIGRPGSVSDNCYHVLTAASSCRIDGFIIARGNANSAAENRIGGGIVFPKDTKTAIVANCTFEKNNADSGGALFIDQANVVVSNCTFYSNSAKSGGAIATAGAAELQVQDSIFSSNFAPESGGAVVLETGARIIFSGTSFLYNSTDGTGGAIIASSESKGGLDIEITSCTFTENSAADGGGAILFKGAFNPYISECTFERNFSTSGAGGIANANGVLAIVSDSTFTGNLGLKGSENIGNDSSSRVASSLQEAGRIAKTPIGRPAPFFSKPKPEKVEKTEPAPKPERTLGDEFVYNTRDTKVKLSSIVAEAPHTVLVLGDLTDPGFIESYRHIEAAARDYQPMGIRFHYIYRYLLHPENNGYVQPINEKERKRHTQLAAQHLSTAIPWLYDTMDNQTAKALAPETINSVFVYDAAGTEIYAGPLSKTADLHTTLVDLAGAVDLPTETESLPKPTIEPVAQLEAKLLKRVSVNPKTDKFLPLQLTPIASKTPHFVKVRVEGNESLRESGDGQIYLGFHMDPLYQTEWNNVGDPLSYALKTPSGVVAPSINSAPRVSEQATDTEPREFLLNARKLDTNKPVTLQVTYSVYSPKLKRNMEVQQQYIIYLDHDPFGGAVIGRQRINKAKPATTATTDGSAFKAMLRRYDLDRNGKLTEDEVIGRLRTYFSEIDTNQDGALDEAEYMFYRENR